MHKGKIATTFVVQQCSSGHGVLVCLCAQAEAATVTLSPAQFEGTGRACFGKLSIQRSEISWTTPFSQCNALPYVLLDQVTSSGKARHTFRFTHTTPTCRYRIISVTHHEAGEPGTGWEVTGYGQEQSYLMDKACGYKANPPDVLSCYLIRDPTRP